MRAEHIAFHWPLRCSGIYIIRNRLDDKIYVGSALNIAGRWKRHLSDLRCGIHHSILLQRAWNKYGQQAFEFIVHSFVPSAFLLTNEQRVLDRSAAATPARGYNVCKVAGSPLGVKHDATVGIARGAKMRGELHPMFGKTHSVEAKAKMSQTRAGRETGTIYTDEIRARISSAAKGRVIPEEQREKIRQSLLGRTRPAESVAKGAAAHRGRVASEETRRRQSIGIKLARANGANQGGRKKVAG